MSTNNYAMTEEKTIVMPFTGGLSATSRPMAIPSYPRTNNPKGNLVDIFGGAFVPPPLPVTIPVLSPEDQMRDAMRKAGIEPPLTIVGDGKIHRFANGGKGEPDCWYVLYPQGRFGAGAFGDWSNGGKKYDFSSVSSTELTPEEQRKAREDIAKAITQAKEAREKAQKEAAIEAQAIWEEAKPADPTNAYLVRKQVGTYHLKQTKDGRLIVPFHDGMGKITTLEYISDDSTKRFLKGGEKKGSYSLIGTIDPTGMAYMAEGYSTAASIHEATGKPVIISGDAGNLQHALATIRGLHPLTHIVIVADNDNSGTGKREADKAAASDVSSNTEVILIPTLGEDANDFVNAGGDLKALLDVKNSLTYSGRRINEFLKKPAPATWLIKHWLLDKGLVMVHGPSGCGKTFLVLDWMLHVSTGQPLWMDKKVKRGSVVYLCGEGHTGMAARAAAWAQAHDVVDLGDMIVSDRATDLDSPEGLRDVINLIRAFEIKPDFLVVDTLNRFLAGDENSAQDTRRFLKSCSDLQDEFDCTVLIIHHTGVDPEKQARARGSSAWRGALDVEISIEKLADKSMKITQVKMKDHQEEEPLYVRLESVAINGWHDDEGEPVTSAVVTPAEKPIEGPSSKDIQSLMKAWNRSDHWTSQDAPYISIDDWVKSMEVDDPITSTDPKEIDKKRNAFKGRLKTSPTASTLANRLIDFKVIEKSDKGGFRVIDDVRASSMMMGIQEKKNDSN